jgi:P2 family phage contractile tail tube protein
MVTHILGDFTVFVDGFGKWGACEELKLPALEQKAEEFRGGGMDAPRKIVLGQEKMAFEFMLTAYDPQVQRLWGLAPGVQKQFTVHGSFIVPGEQEKPAISNITGSMFKLDPGSWEPGEKSDFNVAIGDITCYRHRIDGETIHEIDVLNQIRIATAPISLPFGPATQEYKKR